MRDCAIIITITSTIIMMFKCWRESEKWTQDLLTNKSQLIHIEQHVFQNRVLVYFPFLLPSNCRKINYSILVYSWQWQQTSLYTLEHKGTQEKRGGGGQSKVLRKNTQLSMSLPHNLQTYTIFYYFCQSCQADTGLCCSATICIDKSHTSLKFLWFWLARIPRLDF